MPETILLAATACEALLGFGNAAERELATLFAPARAAHWQSLRHAAIATGLRYRREAQAVKVAAFAATLPERMRRPLGQPRV